KIILLIIAPFAFLSALSAQITRNEADEIVSERMSREVQPYTVYAGENVQTEGVTVTTSGGETLELDYPCRVYYIRYTDTASGRYLIVKESDGNLLEINAKDDAWPSDLAEWKILNKNDYKQTTGYIVGYETCGLTIENGTGHAKGYIVISEDMKDTLTVYNLPQDIYSFPAKIFPETQVWHVNVSFPEQYRYAFKLHMKYTVSSEEEIQHLGLKEYCTISAMYPIIETYKNCVPVIVNSAEKAEDNKILMLMIDYTTNKFKGGQEFEFSENSETFTITNEYKSPGDFGHLKLYYEEINEQLFFGTIIWMGLGKMIFPQNLLAADQFRVVDAADYVTPANGFENVFNLGNQVFDYGPVWGAVQSLVKAREYLRSNPEQVVKLFLYTPSVGEGNPEDWYWIIYLKK
ncbi:MAG: hypothetical protein FWF54_05960, partial [Candidatus Azobacteroides sp.]|nr:hypothetical protein [Candidatus Azobacteroides sp.]